MAKSELISPACPSESLKYLVSNLEGVFFNETEEAPRTLTFNFCKNYKKGQYFKKANVVFLKPQNFSSVDERIDFYAIFLSK